MAYPEFYKKHMELNLGLAPAFTMNHHKLGIYTKLMESDKVVALFKKMCP